jgi:hypothetical protein
LEVKDELAQVQHRSTRLQLDREIDIAVGASLAASDCDLEELRQPEELG